MQCFQMKLVYFTAAVNYVYNIGPRGQCYKFLTIVGYCLYYKHNTIVNYDSSVVNKLGALFTDDARVVIYNRHIIQATVAVTNQTNQSVKFPEVYIE